MTKESASSFHFPFALNDYYVHLSFFALTCMLNNIAHNPRRGGSANVGLDVIEVFLYARQTNNELTSKASFLNVFIPRLFPAPWVFLLRDFLHLVNGIEAAAFVYLSGWHLHEGLSAYTIMCWWERVCTDIWQLSWDSKRLCFPPFISLSPPKRLNLSAGEDVSGNEGINSATEWVRACCQVSKAWRLNIS